MTESNEPTGWRVAVIGAGPAGCFTAGQLLRDPRVAEVAVIERRLAPFGLIRYGVAPDHEPIRRVATVLARTLADPRCRYFGGVDAGTVLDLGVLRRHFHAVVLAAGASRHHPLGIPGEDLDGVMPAGSFVNWYNGHPEAAHPVDLSGPSVVIVGHGNVALDTARMLLRDPGEFAATDMPPEVAEALARSTVREVHLVGRRGPAQAAFGATELREVFGIPDLLVEIDPADLLLDPASAEEAESPATARMLEAFRAVAHAPARHTPHRVRLRFHFRRSPSAFRGEGHVREVVLTPNRLEGPAGQVRPVPLERAEERLPCSMALLATGFVASAWASLPWDTGHARHERGRVLEPEAGLGGVYAAGWIKRGARGLVGQTKADSTETAATLLDDLAGAEAADVSGSSGLEGLLKEAGVRWVSWPEWQRLDAEEIRRGAEAGKSRLRFESEEAMFRFLDGGK